MDRETLLHHRERWGVSPSPPRLGSPDSMTGEATLYADLVDDRYGASVRLEQERIDWGWVRQRLPYA